MNEETEIAGHIVGRAGVTTTVKARVFGKDVAFQSEFISVRNEHEYHLSEGSWDKLPTVGEPISSSGFEHPANNGTKAAIFVSPGLIVVAETLVNEDEGKPIIIGTLVADLGTVVGERTKAEGERTEKLLAKLQKDKTAADARRKEGTNDG